MSTLLPNDIENKFDELLEEELSRLIIENQSEDGSIARADQRAMKDEIMELISRQPSIVEFTYFERGQKCQVNTLYLKPRDTIQVQLDRMPGHFMQVKALSQEGK